MSATLVIDLDDENAVKKLRNLFGLYETETKKAQKETSTWTEITTGLNQAWELGIKIWNIGSKALGFINDQFQRLVLTTAAYDDNLGDLAEVTGVSVTQLEKLFFAGQRVGVQNETITVGIRALTKEMAAAASGNEQSIRTFEMLGIKVTDSNGKLRSAVDVLEDVATWFAKTENGANKNAIALQLFSRSGGEMIPMLNKGKVGIQELGGQLDRLGISINDTSAALAGDLSDNLETLEGLWDGMIRQIGRQLMPAFVDLTREAIKMGEAFIKDVEWHQVASRIGEVTAAMGGLLKIFTYLVEGPLVLFGSLVVTAVAAPLSGLQFILAGIPLALEGVIFGFEKLAEVSGQDGVAKALASARSEVKVFRDTLVGSGLDLANMAGGAVTAGMTLLKASDAAADGAMSLGNKIKDVGEASKTTQESMHSSFSEGGRAIKELAIPPAIALENQLGDTEEAAKKTGGALAKETATGAKHATTEFDLMIDAMELGAVTGVTVFEKNIPGALDKTTASAKKANQELGKVVYSLSAAMGKAAPRYKGPGANTIVENSPWNSTDPSMRGGVDMDFIWGGQFGAPSPFGNITSYGPIDPMMTEISRRGLMTPDRLGDLLVGRATAIEGQKFNMFAESIRNEPILRAAQEETQALYEQKQAAIQARIESIQALNSSAGVGLGLKSIQGVHEQTSRVATEIYGTHIPNAIGATQQVQNGLIAQNSAIASSYAGIGAAAYSAADAISQMAAAGGVGGSSGSSTRSANYNASTRQVAGLTPTAPSYTASPTGGYSSDPNQRRMPTNPTDSVNFQRAMDAESYAMMTRPKVGGGDARTITENAMRNALASDPVNRANAAEKAKVDAALKKAGVQVANQNAPKTKVVFGARVPV